MLWVHIRSALLSLVSSLLLIQERQLSVTDESMYTSTG